MENIEPAVRILQTILSSGEQALTILVILGASAIVWLQYREKARLETRLIAFIEQALKEKEHSIETLRTLTVRHEETLKLLQRTLESRHLTP